MEAWLPHILKFLSSISWPIAAIIVVLLLKSEIKAILGRLSLVKYKEFHAEFERNLMDIERDIKSFVDFRPGFRIPTGTSQEELSDFERLARIADISPAAAITEAWRDIELATKKRPFPETLLFLVQSQALEQYVSLFRKVCFRKISSACTRK